MPAALTTKKGFHKLGPRALAHLLVPNLLLVVTKGPVWINGRGENDFLALAHVVHFSPIPAFQQ